MSEGVVGREGYIIYNLFPVGRESVLTAFKDLLLPENPSVGQVASTQEARHEEMGILCKTNLHVSTSLEDLIESYTPEKADGMRLGSLIFHRALRKEAKSRGGVLPTFTEKFVKDYDDQTQSSAEKSAEEAFLYRGLNLKEAGRELRRKNIVIFSNSEPEFSKIVREKLYLRSDSRPEENLIYSGIIDLYLLIKKGFSDPKNFKDIFFP